MDWLEQVSAYMIRKHRLDVPRRNEFTTTQDRDFFREIRVLKTALREMTDRARKMEGMMKKVVLILGLISLLWAAPVLALPTLPPPHDLTCDPLPAGDNDTGVNVYYSQGIASITKANPGVVTTALPHGLTNGAAGMFWGLAGMTQLNGKTVTVTVVNSTSFSIGLNTTTYGTFAPGSGGFFDNGHRVVDGRIDTTPYDLTGLALPAGTYYIAGTAVNAAGESGFSNVVPFTVPAQALPASPPNLRTQ